MAEKISHSCRKEDIRIAVAQNANDQAETVLFRLLRGQERDGIAGIAYEREERGYKVIRPLLDVYRDEIERYCDYNGLQPRIDHTNMETVYSRNKIRNELIPYIEKEYNGNIMESMVRLARIAAADKEYMWQKAEEEYRRLATENIEEKAVTMERERLAASTRRCCHRVILKAFAAIGLESAHFRGAYKGGRQNNREKAGSQNRAVSERVYTDGGKR